MVVSDVVWRRRECVSAELEGDLVLLDLETLKYHALNATATAVWEILAEPQTADGVAAELCNRYEVDPQECRRSVDGLLSTLAERSLITKQ